jgi:periplasmic protein TonB
VASSASNASQNIETNGGEGPSSSGSSPSARVAVEVIAITNRDDFLLELSESLSGQASVRPVDSMGAALSYLGSSRRLHLLVVDSRDVQDLRGDVERAMAQAPHATIVLFAGSDAEKVVAGSFKGSGVFAVLPIPVDRRKTAAIFEGALADAVSRRSRAPEPPRADPRAGEIRVEAKPEVAFDLDPPRVSGPDEPPTPQISKTMMIGAAVAVVVVAAGGFFLFSKDDSAAPPSVAGAPASKSAPDAAAKDAAESTAPVVSSAVEVPLVKGRTDELLEKARLAMRERRYTEPANDSALLYYRSALAADPTNGEAADGMARVGNLLMTRFEESMTESRYDEAAGALASLKVSMPSDPRLAGFESRLLQAQINKALSGSDIERASALVRQAQQSNAIPGDQLAKLRNEISKRQDEARVKRLVEAVNDRIRDGRLNEPTGDSAKDYIAQLREVPGTNATVQRLTRELNAGYFRKAREAQAAGRQPEADRWVAEARASGASNAEILAFQRDAASQRQRAVQAETERLAQAVRDRLRDGRLTEPTNDSAMTLLAQLNQADTSGATGSALGRELSGKLIERATVAARNGRNAQMESDLAAARRLGADPVDIQTVQQLAARAASSNSSAAAQTAAIQPRPTPQVTKLKRVRYAPPEYPQKAFQQKLSGSVTVEFVVDVNGEPRDARVVDSDPPEIFDKAAITAVKRWRYEPVVVNNVPTEVPTRMVIRFELPK